jgi:hypothetical protein
MEDLTGIGVDHHRGGILACGSRQAACGQCHEHSSQKRRKIQPAMDTHGSDAFRQSPVG